MGITVRPRSRGYNRWQSSWAVAPLRDEFRRGSPEGQVLSRETGHGRSYGRNPYVGCDRIDQSPFL